MAVNKKKTGGLGAGVGALFSGSTLDDIQEISGASGSAVVEIKIGDIEPGMGQPRTCFDEDKIAQLAESIKEHGVIQPLIVRKEGKVYRIIAGERRWRAARVAGLETVPVIEKDVGDREVVEMALIENIQREDLNPLEEAEAYQRLITEFNLTQEKLSQRLSKSRPMIANKLRLLDLDDNVKAYVTSGELSEGHARTLLGIKDKDLVAKAAEEIINGGYSVRQTEELVKKINNPAKTKTEPAEKKANESLYNIAVKDMENKLKTRFKANVKLQDEGGKGKITITFTSADERERILDMLLRN